jgi:PAS domain S-box-containing protein
MDPELTNFEFFKKKPAEPAAAPSPPSPAAAAPSRPSQTELRNRMLMSAMAKKYESGGAPSQNGTRTVVASVTVDGNGRIAAVDEHCTTMFGWKGQELIGQHLKVLLREGSENQLGSLLQPHRSYDSNNQLFSLKVIARRMDGREFAASLTRLQWTPEAPVKTRNTALHLHDCWTAVFRELAANDVVATPSVPVDDVRHAPVSGRMEDVPQYQGSPATLRSANQELQKKLEAMSVEAYKKSEALTKAEKEREELLTQFQAQEAELKTARASLEQELERRKRFEQQLHQVTSQKAALDKQLSERNKNKDEGAKDLRDQLSQAKLAAERAEAARQQEALRADGFKQALANLQQNYDSLNSRASNDHHGSADYRRRIEELESVLRGTSAEAERANAELEKRMTERNRLEAEWQDQVRIAKASVERAEAAYKQEVARADRAERDLMNLRHGYDEVNAKLTAELHASAEAKRRVRDLENAARDSAAEVERANALLQKHNVERNRIGSEWQDQIDSAKEAAERAEAAHKQEAQRATRLERDLATLRERYDEMDGKVAAEQRAAAEARRRMKEMETQLRDNTAELERALEEREKHVQGRGAIESELRAQLNAVRADAERIETNLKEKVAQFNRLEQEMANLRYERDELQNKYAIEKDAGAKAKRRIKQLEKQVRDGAGNTEVRVVDRRLEAELQAELAQVKAGAERASAEAKHRIDELEKRLSQSAAELARTKASLQNHGAHRSEGSEQLTKELGRLREKESAHAVELSELERRVRDGVSSLARVTAEVETERSERRRSEERFHALSEQLQQLHSELRKHLDSEKVNKTKVDELAQRVQEWRRDKAA